MSDGNETPGRGERVARRVKAAIGATIGFARRYIGTGRNLAAVALVAALFFAPGYYWLGGLYKVERYVDFDYLTASDLGKIDLIVSRYRDDPYLGIIPKVLKTGPENARWLIFREAEFAYYGNRPFIAHTDPRLIPLYRSDKVEDAVAFLNENAIDYIFVPYRHPPTLYNTVFKDIIGDPRYATLTASSGSFQIFKVNRDDREIVYAPVVRRTIAGVEGDDADSSLVMSEDDGAKWQHVGEELDCRVYKLPEEQFPVQADYAYRIQGSLAGSGDARLRLYQYEPDAADRFWSRPIAHEQLVWSGRLSQQPLPFSSQFEPDFEKGGFYFRVEVSPGAKLDLSQFNIGAEEIRRDDATGDPEDWNIVNGDDAILSSEKYDFATGAQQQSVIWGMRRPHTQAKYVNLDIPVAGNAGYEVRGTAQIDGPVYMVVLFLDDEGEPISRLKDANLSDLIDPETGQFSLRFSTPGKTRYISVRYTVPPNTRLELTENQVHRAGGGVTGRIGALFGNLGLLGASGATMSEPVVVANTTSDAYRELFVGDRLFDAYKAMGDTVFRVEPGQDYRVRFKASGQGRASMIAIFRDDNGNLLGTTGLWHGRLRPQTRHLNLRYSAPSNVRFVHYYLQFSTENGDVSVADLRHDRMQLEQVVADDLISSIDRIAIENVRRKNPYKPWKMMEDNLYVGPTKSCTITARDYYSYHLSSSKRYLITGTLEGDAYLSLYATNFDADYLPTPVRDIIWSGVVADGRRDFSVQYIPPAEGRSTLFSLTRHGGKRIKLSNLKIREIK